MTGPKRSIVSTTTTTTSASRLLLLSIHSSTSGVRFPVDCAFFNSFSFILNPPGFECGGEEDGPSTCVCASHVHCLLRRQFTVRGSARVYTSLKCTQMHLHHITLTSPHPIAIGDTSHTFGKPSWFRNVCALLDALQPLLACFPACLLLLLCIVLSREYPGGHPTSDVSRVGT